MTAATITMTTTTTPATTTGDNAAVASGGGGGGGGVSGGGQAIAELESGLVTMSDLYNKYAKKFRMFDLQVRSGC